MGKKSKKKSELSSNDTLFDDYEMETEMIFDIKAQECQANKNSPSYVYYLDENEEMEKQDLDFDTENLEFDGARTENLSKPEKFAHKERKCLCRGCYMALKGAHERLFGKKLGYTSEDKLSVYQSIDDFLHYTQFFDLAHFTEQNKNDIPVILHMIYSNQDKKEQSLCDSTMNDVTDLIFERVILPSMTPEERLRHFGNGEGHHLPNSSLHGPKDGMPSSSFYI